MTNIKRYFPAVIGFVAFLLLLIGASFAYFSARVTNLANTNMSLTLPNKTVIYTDGSSCAMDLTYEEMANIVDNKATVAETSYCILNVTIAGSNTAYCTYNLVLNEIGNDTYIPSDGVGNIEPYEFTGTLYVTDTPSTSQNIQITGDYDLLKAETNINNLKGILKSNEMISVKNDSQQITKQYLFEIKWYNLPISQNNQYAKDYLFQLNTTDIKC